MIVLLVVHSALCEAVMFNAVRRNLLKSILVTPFALLFKTPAQAEPAKPVTSEPMPTPIDESAYWPYGEAEKMIPGSHPRLALRFKVRTWGYIEDTEIKPGVWCYVQKYASICLAGPSENEMYLVTDMKMVNGVETVQLWIPEKELRNAHPAVVVACSNALRKRLKQVATRI